MNLLIHNFAIVLHDKMLEKGFSLPKEKAYSIANSMDQSSFDMDAQAGSLSIDSSKIRFFRI
jgi:hypothetical protein